MNKNKISNESLLLLTRRSFLKKTALISVSTAISLDPFLRNLAFASNESESDLVNKIDCCVDIFRPDDLLKLKLYFFNFEIRSFLGHKRLFKKKQNAYIIVRLSQQHIAEELFPGAPCPEALSKSFLSGFSYLSFKVSDAFLNLDSSTLLDWSRFSLLTVEDIEDYDKTKAIRLDESSNYPLKINEYKNDFPNKYKGLLNEDKIPVTLIELPYKIILSPTIPGIELQNKNYSYVFKNNNQREYYNRRIFKPGHKPTDHTHITLNELWNSQLNILDSTIEDQYKVHEPRFKVIAFEETYTDQEEKLLPSPKNKDRQDLASVTNIDLSDQRDVIGNEFKLTTLGATTNLHYKNLDPAGYRIFEWKQDTQLARDNYVEITERGIDVRSGLKVLISSIAQRRNDFGISYLWHRLRFQYQEKEKSYPQGCKFGQYNFRKIIAIEDGAYFTQAVVDANNNKTKGFFHLIEEPSPREGKCQDEPSLKEPTELGSHDIDKLLKFKYIGIDHDGNEIPFDMDAFLIYKKDFKKNIENAREAMLKGLSLEKFKARFQVNFNLKKIAYVPSVVSEKSGEKINSALKTDVAQYSFKYHSELDFKDQYPIIPELVYSKVIIPQLEGIESNPVPRNVGYTPRFNKYQLDNTANPAQIYLKTLPIEIETFSHKSSNLYKNIESIRQGPATPIKRIFTENYRNSGGAVNPDINIESISLREQSIALIDTMNPPLEENNCDKDREDKILSKSVGSNFNYLKPNDIFRGLNAEIFGGIKLIDILEAYLPLDDLPIFEALEFADEGIQQIEKFAAEYNALKTKIESLPKDIELISEQLVKTIKGEAKNIFDEYVNMQRSKLVYDLAQLKNEQDETFISILKKAKDDLENDYISLLKIIFYDELNLKSEINNLEKHLKELNNKLKDLETNAELTINTELNRIINDYESIGIEIEKKIISELGDSGEQAKRQINLFLTKLDEYLNFSINKLISKEVINFNPSIDHPLLHKWYSNQEISQPGVTFTERKRILETVNKKLYISKWFAEYEKTLSGELRVFTQKIHASIDDEIKYLDDYIDHEVNRLNNVLSVLKNFDLRNVLPSSIEDKFVSLLNYYNLVREISTVLENGFKPYLDLISYYDDLEYELSTLDKSKSYYKKISNIIENRKKELLAQSKNILINIKKNSLLILKNKIDEIKKEVRYKKYPGYQNILRTLDDLENEIKNIPAIDDIEKIKIALSSYQEKINKFKKYPEEIDNKLNQIIDAPRQLLLKKKKELELELDVYKSKIENFIKDKLKELEEDFVKQNKELIEAVKEGEQKAKRVKQRIDEIKRQIEAIKSLNKKEILYDWHTEKFNNADIGIVKFVKKDGPPTRLDIKVQTTVNFDLTNLPSPPRVDKVSVFSENKLINFDVTFLDIVTVSFSHVKIVAGTDVKDDYDVKIEDVKFNGPLNFVEYLQSLLSTLDKNLMLDINAKGATLYYGVPIPPISSGIFNLANIKLSFGFHLPFESGKPMLVLFGFSHPKDLFLLSVGIFGGRGCVMIGIDPKHGVVDLIVVFEFGGVLYLNIGVAEGILFLMAGIYIRKRSGFAELRAYIVAGGALRIIGLITASITFYLGLQAEGQNYRVLSGYCNVYYTIKLGKFFKKTVGMGMRKSIPSGVTGSSANKQNDDQTLLSVNGNPSPRAKAKEINQQDYSEWEKVDWDGFFSSYYDPKIVISEYNNNCNK